MRALSDADRARLLAAGAVHCPVCTRLLLAAAAVVPLHKPLSRHTAPHCPGSDQPLPTPPPAGRSRVGGDPEQSGRIAQAREVPEPVHG